MILVRCRDQRPGTVADVLDRLSESPASDRLRGNLVVVSEGTIRVHTRG